jgi:hypothetical protein
MLVASTRPDGLDAFTGFAINSFIFGIISIFPP